MEQRKDYIERQITEFGKALQRILGFDSEGESVIHDDDLFVVLKGTLGVDLENEIISRESLILLLDSNVIDRIEIVKMIEILEYRIKNKFTTTVLLKNLLALIDYIQESGQYSLEFHFKKIGIEKLLQKE